ncbi:MAG: PEP-CTERM sorting domain-containing protein [Mariniblastus sp.]|nr:PEP-CTERM sorting domain-containing protein [Mariniblastus sp.]
MKKSSFYVGLLFCFVSSSLFGQGQISPNPNPEGNTIKLTTGSWSNSQIFQNDGTIDGNLSGAVFTNDNTLNNGSKGTIGFAAAWTNPIFATINNSGIFAPNGGGSFTNSGHFNNEQGGTFESDAPVDNKAPGLINNSGTFQLYWGGTLNNASGSYFNNLSGGTVNIETQSIVTNDGSLTNSGQINVQQSSALFNTTSGTLTNNGTIDTTHGTLTNNGTLNGSGRIIGSYTDHGLTKPGNSAGVMTIDGDYFKVDGSKEIELGGLFDGGGDKTLTEFDWVDVTGNVELAGTLDVSLIDGFNLHRGNEFNFLRVDGTLSGQYDDLGEGDLVGNFGGQDLFITYGGGDGNDVGLFTNAVPEPTTLLIWSMLAGVGMSVRRRR